jgi:hypothetical protein
MPRQYGMTKTLCHVTPGICLNSQKTMNVTLQLYSVILVSSRGNNYVQLYIVHGCQSVMWSRTTRETGLKSYDEWSLF